jgi:hypothetical protein
MALVDSGANISSLDKEFCLKNKIAVTMYDEPVLVGLADSKFQSVIYGRTEAMTIHYNYKTYKVNLNIMDLANDKDMSIGTDLMTTLGIGYTGLAVSTNSPPHPRPRPLPRCVDSDCLGSAFIVIVWALRGAKIQFFNPRQL